MLYNGLFRRTSQGQRRLYGVFLPYSETQEQKFWESKFITLLNCCTDISEIKQVHALIYRRGFEQCSFVLTKFIRTLTKFGVSMDDYARVLFQQAEKPNHFLWTALIRGYALSGCLTECVNLYSCMRRDNTSPGSFAFSALFKACTAVLDVSLGRQFHGQTIKIGGFERDLHVYNTLIYMYVECGILDCGHKLFDEMPVKDVISGTSLIVAYTKIGEIDAAMELFERLPGKDMVSWNAMITCYAQNARPGEALVLFEKMTKLCKIVDEITLTSAISACAQLGAIKYATWVKTIAKESGFGHEDDVFIGSALIDMYSKCGCLKSACNIFKEMNKKNIYTYTSMIAGFATHGLATSAVQLFHEMVNNTEIRPNVVTFIAVLSACSHAGMVEEGRRLFASMTESYGVPPSADHYTCMVDLYGRAGCFEDALDLIKSMPVEPHAAIWGALLGACRIHRNPDVAKIAATRLFELEPDCKGNYDLLANIYASAGRWDDVSSLRTSMKQKKLKKTPGCSWVEGRDGHIHKFFVDDLTRSKYGTLKLVLEDLLDQMKLLGYQPHLSSVSYDVHDDIKRQMLMAHSEKLALVYALLNTNMGSALRIMKNLRICEDCHSFMSAASKITEREIIVRDNMRFHHFSNGECSCKNFW